MTGMPEQVAIIVTRREYDALLAASALYDVEQEGNDFDREKAEDSKALERMRRKMRDAGLIGSMEYRMRAASGR